jgi:hypothetical protein
VKTGDIVEGKVSYIGTHSFTVQVGDYSGLLLGRDYDWLDIESKISQVKVDDCVRAVVTKVFENEKQMNLSAKELKPDPFVISANKIIEEGNTIRGILPKLNRSFISMLNGGPSVNLKLESGFLVTVYLKDSLIPVDELVEGEEYLFYASKIDYEYRQIKLQLIDKYPI